MGKKELNKFQFDELFRSNDTERVRAVTKTTAPSTHCQRALPAKFQFVKQMKTAAYDDVGGCAISTMLGQVELMTTIALLNLGVPT